MHPAWLNSCRRPYSRPVSLWWSRITVGLLALAAPLWAESAIAAERIYLSYGILQRSIPVDSLETYARTGHIDQELKNYTRYATPEQLEQLREALITPIDLTPVAVSQFLYTPQGETLLQRIGEIVQSEARQSGFYALRAALILAADSEDGLTLLNVLQEFPTRGIRINLDRSLDLADEFREAINQTYAAVRVIQTQAVQEAEIEPAVNAMALPDPQLTGPFNWVKSTFRLTDVDRNRVFPVDLYLPQVTANAPDDTFPAPLVVISHGLGNDRNSYAYLAKHLVSHGFAVAVPEHPGSSADQLQALLQGQASEVTEPQELLNRPLDITYLLNALEQQAQLDPSLQGQINFNNVGIVGQSFGGYTALALAGADINGRALRKGCQDLSSSLNLSLLLQCQGRFLPSPPPSLRDPRIRAAIAINPVGSVVFGPEGFRQIETPLMIVTGNADTVAPALPEQIRPFTWLTNAQRYLLLIQGSTHFSTIGANAPESEVVPLPPAIIGPTPELAQRYVNAMSTVFFEVHLAGNARYQPLLTSSYTSLISQEPLPLRLIESLSPVQLNTAIANFSDSEDSNEFQPGGNVPLSTDPDLPLPPLDPPMELQSAIAPIPNPRISVD